MSNPDNVERLFLLEILVDNVYINTSELNLDPKTISSLKQTCVRFQFLNYPALEICEEDFTPKAEYDEDKVSFKSGKSCLFAVRGQHPRAFTPPFNMNVSVCKMQSNKKQCTIGTACIELGVSFATIVNCCIVCPESPTSKTIKQTYPVLDDRDCEIGNITVFIRLSCFGKQIITQFQLGGLENKSFLFRADSDSFKKDGETEEAKEPKVLIPTSAMEPISKAETFCQQVGGVPPAPRRPSGPCGPPQAMGGMPGMGMGMPPGMGMPGMGMGMPPGMGMPGMGMGMPPGMGMPGMGMGMPSGMGGGMGMGMPPGMGGGMPCMGMPGMMAPSPITGSGVSRPRMGPSPCDKGGTAGVGEQYKELKASVDGHELVIKILRKPKKPKVTKLVSSSEESFGAKVENRIAMEKLKKAFCQCNIPFPKELLEAQCKKFRKARDLHNEPCPFETGVQQCK